MGSIYLITNTANNAKYVGQTIQKAENRWRAHQKNARNLSKVLSGELKTCEEMTSYLYNSMVQHGIDKFTFNVIAAEVPDDQLDELEIKYIKEYNTLRPHGYNLTTGGGHFRHHESTKKLMSDKAKAAAPLLIDKYRKEETKGLPMYIVSHAKGNSTGYAVCGHPLCSYKSFTLCSYKSLDECKIAACQFLKDLEAAGTIHAGKQKPEDLPIGVTKTTRGYQVAKKINGVEYRKAFTSSKVSSDQKRQNAIEYLESILNESSSTTKCQSVSS